jgi:hypothetical protein
MDMSEWAFVSFDDFLTQLEEVNQGALALVAREFPLPVQLRDEPPQTTGARLNCVLRISNYVRDHVEAFWGAGLLQDREHFLGVQIRLWRAVHTYFTDPAREADAPDPATADIIRIALADTR